MQKRTRLRHQLSIGVAAIVATGSSATTVAANPQSETNTTTDTDNSVKTANGEETFELCKPDFGNGKVGELDFFFSTNFTVEGSDGLVITDTTGLTFEVVNNTTVVDVTEHVTLVEELLDFSAIPDFYGEGISFNQFFDTPISTYAPPLSAPGLFQLGCRSATTTVENPSLNDWNLQPFPTGTTILAKRNGITIATGDISGRSTLFDPASPPGIIKLLIDLFPNDELFSGCNVELKAIESYVSVANDVLPCSPFSDFYGAMVDATGRRLHPSFAYFATLLPAVLVNLCVYAGGDDCDIFFGPTSEHDASLVNKNVSSRLSSLLSSSSLVSSALQLTPPRITQNQSLQSNSITTQTPWFEYCFASHLLAVVPLQSFLDNVNSGDDPPNPFDGDGPFFHITAMGRGMADALSDPRVTAWPEIDICFFEETDFLGFGTFQLILELYLIQLFLVDIPLGLTPSSWGFGEQSTAVQLTSLTRIPWQWTDDTLAAIKVGQPYADGVAANGTPVPTYSVTSGSLPTGLSLDPVTGAITGTPTKQGAFSFAITATNSVGALTKSFTLGTTVTARPKLRANRANKLVTFNGRVPASFTGKRVLFQQRVNGKWKTIQRLEVAGNRRVTTSVFTRQVKRYRIVAGINPSLPIRK